MAQLPTKQCILPDGSAGVTVALQVAVPVRFSNLPNGLPDCYGYLADGVTQSDLISRAADYKLLDAGPGKGQIQVVDASGSVLATTDVFTVPQP